MREDTADLSRLQTEAAQGLAEALDQVQAALQSAEIAARVYAHAMALQSNDPQAVLAARAGQHGARWGGGPLDIKNIEETISREAALKLLVGEQWRGRVWKLRPLL